jgi:hemoglobin
MARDIETREDLEQLLTEFYSVAMTDAKIGYYFTCIAQLDLKTHLPVITDFWEKVLFGKPVYFRNPMIIHHELHEKSPFEKEHFDRWLEIWTATIDRLFRGETADKAKDKAATIARAMFSSLVENVEPKIYSLAQEK